MPAKPILPALSRRTFSAGLGAAFIARPALAATPIDDQGFVAIGGIEQWIAIQGNNVGNPVILFLHGGPGEAQSPFLNQFRTWQTDFTVANWDQRGAGKTYGRNGAATPGMTLDRMVEDVCEVAAHLCARLSQKKVILVGQSWGSYLGVHAVKRRPDLFHAYVGTGQVVDIKSTILDLARHARQMAAQSNDQTALDALDKAAALPDPARLAALRRASGKWAMSEADLPYTKMLDDFRNSTNDAADWVAGARFSGRTIGASLTDMDLRALGLEMPVPFFIIQGRDDHLTGLEPARAYEQEISAPRKAFTAIDGGHYACFTNSGAFLAALRAHVTPLVPRW